MIQEFKDFINRGNVLDLAVAVVLGAAFGAVVTSFVDDVLMQIIAAIGGEPDFSALTIDLGDSELRYGSFLTAIISFVLIAFGVFLVVKAVNAAEAGEGGGAGGPVRGRAADPDPGPAPASARPALERARDRVGGLVAAPGDVLGPEPAVPVAQVVATGRVGVPRRR